MTTKRPYSVRRDGLEWVCADPDCLHDGVCRERVLFADDSFTQIRGTMTFNPDDGKWDWCVSVDYYGSSLMPDVQVEAMASRYARKMASLVHPEAVAVLHAIDDDAG